VRGRVEGKVALITGAARGQGRAHAVRLAEEGADIVAFDICGPIAGRENVPAAAPEDLAETARQVEALDRRIVTIQGDTRDLADLERAVEAGLSKLGHIDIAIANAGVAGGMSRAHEISEGDWHTTVDVNLTGVWHTAKAVLPAMIEARTGSIVLTSSGAGVKAMLHLADYAPTKAAVIMLARVLALEYAEYGIRANSICPGNVETPLVINDAAFKLFRPDLPNPNRADVEPIVAALSPLKSPSGWLDPREIAHAVLWLSSDEAAYVSGINLAVDQAFSAG
jgi:(+)-trans-carveol dehydrogenase